MSTTIDERIVSMKFNNADFQKRISDTVSSMGKLKSSLNLKGAQRSLQDLDRAGKNFNLSTMASGIENISARFSAMSVVGIAALSTIAVKATEVGLRLATSLLIDPAKSGLQEYETNLNSIQTILANTSAKGSTLEDVNNALETLNEYSDKTIYNFSEMARNIGTFTAAGVDLDTSTQAIKGIANLAAVSGSNSQQASTAMYQLSQALSSGTVKLMDWNSVVNAGMGGEVFQNALKDTARVHGIAIDDMIDQAGSFRDSLQKGWLSSEILTETLSKFTGELTDEQLKSMGYTQQQIADIQEMAKGAVDAATKVKTVSQLMGTLSEVAGSGWAKTWQLIIGDFDQAKGLFTALSDEFGGIIQASADARNELIGDWNELGGREVVIEGLVNVWEALKAIVAPIRDAFRDIFPPATGQTLLTISEAFRDFTETLMPSKDTLEDIGRTAKGFFALLDIGWMIIQQVIGLLGRLFSGVSEAGGGFLKITGNIGDFIVGIRDAIKNGTGLETVFRVIGDAIENVINFLRASGEATTDFLQIESWGQAWEGVANALQKVAEFLQPVWDFLGEFFTNAKEVIGEFFRTMDFGVLVGLLNVGALVGVGVLVKKAIDGFTKIFEGGPGGIIDSIKSIFTAVTDTFKAMQTNLKADALQKIAIAIGIMTAAVIALSFVDTARLFIALGAMTVMFGQLSAMLFAMDRLIKTTNPTMIIGMSAALILLSTAMVIFASAVAILSALSWEGLAKGLIGLAVGMGLMVGALVLLTKAPAVKMMLASAAMVAIATSLLILSAALKIFSTMSWDDIVRSMVAMGGALAILMVAMSKMQSALFGAASLIIVATAITILSGAMKVFSTMSWDDIGRSLVMLAGSMLILTVALSAMQSAVLGAASLLIVSAAITVLSGAMKVFATMSWDDIGRSLVVLGGTLAILAAGMALMGIPIVLLGALGIIAAAGALMVLAPAMKILGSMSWDDIGRGLTVLAGALAILAVGGVLLLPSIPAFLALGAAILMVGAGTLAAGTGLLFLAAGIMALAAAGAVGAEAIRMAIMTIIGLIPMAMAAFAQGLIDFAVVIATGGAEFTEAMSVLIQSLLEAIKTNGPLLIDTIWELIVALVDKIVEGVPYFVDSGMKLIIGVLQGIGDNIGALIDAGADVIVNFLQGIQDNVQDIIDEGAETIVAILDGIATGIENNKQGFIDAGSRIFRAVVDGVASAIEQGGADLAWAGGRIGEGIINGAMNALGINSPSKVFRDYIMGSVFEGIEDGGDKGENRARHAGENLGAVMVAGVANTIAGLASAVQMDLDMSPTIRPVLDMTQFKRDAQGMGNVMTAPVVRPTTSLEAAQDIQAAVDSRPSADVSVAGPTKIVEVKMEQTNISPEPLTTAEIYRRTNNQVSQVKGILEDEDV